jgi:phosphopantothenoylcysteine decarboxylase/phosphopantothenate--cysteine ligase
MAEQRRARRMLLCAAGGYQSFMLPAFIMSLLQNFADDVQVVVSPAAKKLVSVYSIEAASRHKVFVEMDDEGPGVFVPHIELGRNIDLVLVYPATINIIGKVANGIADELIAAIILATSAPVVFVPIANEAMWRHPATRRNLETLRSDGYIVLPPLPGWEVATREGIDQLPPFPIPTLLAQMSAAIHGESTAGRARRTSD